MRGVGRLETFLVDEDAVMIMAVRDMRKSLTHAQDAIFNNKYEQCSFYLGKIDVFLEILESQIPDEEEEQDEQKKEELEM